MGWENKMNLKNGDIFGTNKIIERDFSKKREYWVCECQICKSIRSVRSDNLYQKCRSCAASNKRKTGIKDNLTGRQFGNWTVLYKANKSNYWHCKCKCGEEKDVFRGNLTSGKSLGCGCTNSWGETQLKYLFNKYDIFYSTQFSFSDLKTDKNYKVRFDFVIYDNLNNIFCLVEYDGRQHFQFDNNWKMTKEDYERLVYIDNLKNEYCKNNNILLYRVNKNTNLENFVSNLAEELNKKNERGE
jgi:hypothetical protein